MRRDVVALAWLRDLAGSPRYAIGLTLVCLAGLLALLGPVIVPYDYAAFNLTEVLQPPSLRHLLGTDQFGRDVFTRVVLGSRTTLVMSMGGVGLGLLLGTIVGMVAGYAGGSVNELSMRAMDVMMAFPPLLLAMVILTVLGPSLQNTILSIGLVFAPRIARVVHSVALGLRTQEFVAAAQVRGEAPWYIVFREMLPNAWTPILVEASVRLSYAILLGTSLGFLGLGVQPPTPDWGLMIGDARNYLQVAPWLALFPSAAVVFSVLGFNLLSDRTGPL